MLSQLHRRDAPTQKENINPETVATRSENGPLEEEGPPIRAVLRWREAHLPETLRAAHVLLPQEALLPGGCHERSGPTCLNTRHLQSKDFPSQFCFELEEKPNVISVCHMILLSLSPPHLPLSQIQGPLSDSVTNSSGTCDFTKSHLPISSFPCNWISFQSRSCL